MADPVTGTRSGNDSLIAIVTYTVDQRLILMSCDRIEDLVVIDERE